MVEWKGDISLENSGGKAYRLDSVDNLEVPNFFVITREDVKELVRNREPENVLERDFTGDTWNKVEKAYNEVGMSSEVRNASGKARNLVGGQRNKQLVSVRVSGDRKGVFEYRLNIGSSGFETAVKEILKSFFEAETEHDFPAIIVQKMVEPEFSGAVINYLGDYHLIEAVEDLGVSIEEGITTPSFYLVDEKVEDRRVPENQLVVKRNNMSGKHEKRKKKPEKPFSNEEVEELVEKVRETGMDVKFTYKRGSFYIVDAFQPRNQHPFETFSTSLEGIRVSEGEINGEIGRGVAYTEETIEPEKYSEALICQKGGYTSTDAQLARQRNKPAVFSFRQELEHGQKISFTSTEFEESQAETGMNEIPSTASEVLQIGEDIKLEPPFKEPRYAVTDRPSKGKIIPLSGHLTDYSQIFGFKGDRAVLDARKLERNGLEQAIEYIEADLKILLIDRPEQKVIQKAVENNFTVFGTSGNRERLEKIVEREERRFMINKLRELSS